MESYRRLYQITVKHEYFGEKPCPSLKLCLSRESEALMYRRGMLFRETGIGCWTLFFNEKPDTDKDVLHLELSVADPNFALYTDWPGFKPSERYELQLPASEGLIDATSAILHTDKKRCIGSGFCGIALRLNEKLVEAAKLGKAEEAVLQFHGLKKHWEYLFIPQGDEEIDGKQLLLEDATGNIRFSPFTPCEAYGRNAWRTVSENPIPMRDTYGCRLRLAAMLNNRKQKRILLSQIETPQPGKYMDNPDFLRQVCYF